VKGSTFHSVLPPGKFVLEGGGKDVNPVSKEIEIKAGQRLLDLGTRELDAKQFILLEGKPAPELDDIIEWKNGPGPKLAGLRGKFVLLEFWGWWCASCVERGIPELFKLQDEFLGKDLVIIGVHTPADEDDKIDSVAKLDNKLALARKNIWNRRDISFPVAISRVKMGSYSPGEPMTAASQICFDYGVCAFPTAVLIDREGKVVGRFDPGNDLDRAKLKKLLDVK
jgi:thiol-disulfide isomerase/thioredoxin